jgi:phosphoribosylglycinamide formyltransferase-1
MSAGSEIHLAIFASGNGSNAASIIKYFKGHSTIKISLILYNRKMAGVQHHAAANNIPSQYCPQLVINDQHECEKIWNEYKIDGIILAGYLSLIPPHIIHRFQGKILNIHPALLPSFGGHGMYGHHVHESVSLSGCSVTGLTIHLVNEEYDQGAIIYQCRVPIQPYTKPEEIAAQVLLYEHLSYPLIIDNFFGNKS